MERQFVHCPECDDYMEVNYYRGKWYCENCGKDLTKETKRQMEREAEYNKKHKKHRK